jgi:hypothetical protein
MSLLVMKSRHALAPTAEDLAALAGLALQRRNILGTLLAERWMTDQEVNGQSVQSPGVEA